MILHDIYSFSLIFNNEMSQQMIGLCLETRAQLFSGKENHFYLPTLQITLTSHDLILDFFFIPLIFLGYFREP